MGTDRRSIGHHIDELARRTGAPASLVEEIRAIFTRSGVPLERDALPYLEILEETFSRAALLEQDNTSARDAIDRQEENSRRFADSCLELYGQLRSMEDYLKGGGDSSVEASARRRRQARERTAARRKAAEDPGRPFFVILTPSDPE
jgi:hypothetical protein